MSFCPQCGSQLEGQPRFCDQCGAPLVVRAGPDSGARAEAGVVTIGRASDNTIVVPWNAPGVSRYHARVTFVGDGMSIEDAGTPNGTWLNGHRVHGPTTFTLADEVRLGHRYLLNKAQLLAVKLEL